MKKISCAACAAVLSLLYATVLSAQTTVYNSIPVPTPPNVPSQGFQCCQNDSRRGNLATLQMWQTCPSCQRNA